MEGLIGAVGMLPLITHPGGTQGSAPWLHEIHRKSVGIYEPTDIR